MKVFRVGRVLKYIAVLGVCLTAVGGIASFVMSTKVGAEAYSAGALATFVVWLSGSIALFITSMPSEQNSNVTKMLLAMLLRLALPMGTVLAVQQSGSSLFEAGFAGMVVINYLAALVLETAMSLRVNSPEACPNASA